MKFLKDKIRRNKYYPYIKKKLLKYHNFRRDLLKIKYIIISKFLGIDIKLTASFIYGDNSDNNEYVPVYSWYIKRIMKVFNISQNDNLLDYGSGKGAAMIFFAKYSFNRIDGVEYDKYLHEIAESNFKIKNLKHLNSYNVDATQFIDIDFYTFYFFYNPFHGKVLELTIEQLKNSYIRNPRKIIIIYQNPLGGQLFINSELFKNIFHCFIPSIININKNNKRYGRQFIDIYCTESLQIDFNKYGIKLIENACDK